MTTLGVDIGGTAVKAAVLAPDGHVRTSVSTPYARPDRVQLRTAVREAAEQLDLDRVEAVGLCVPGRRAPSGRCVDLAVNVPGLEGYEFERIVADAVGRSIPLRVCSDAEAATIDAARDHPHADRILGIAIGTGVGTSLVEHGRALRLGDGTIGHLGQLDIGLLPGVEPPGPLGPDGGRNSLEAYLGVGALRTRLGPDFADHLGRLAPSDPALLALVRAIRIGVGVYTPQLVLVLGGLGIALRVHREAIERMVRLDLTSVAPRGWQLDFGRSRFHAAQGAARLAVDISAPAGS